MTTTFFERMDEATAAAGPGDYILAIKSHPAGGGDLVGYLVTSCIKAYAHRSYVVMRRPTGEAETAPAPKYVAVGPTVVNGGQTVARAISKTLAKRIANALNRHKPNAEGV